MKKTKRLKKYFADRKDKFSISGTSIEMDWLLIVLGFLLLSIFVITISIGKITAISSGEVFENTEIKNTLGDDSALKKVDSVLDFFENKEMNSKKSSTIEPEEL